MTAFRVAYLISHPIQYQVPLIRRLAAHPELDLTVYYMDDVGAREYHDPEFDVAVRWDLPMLDGYAWRVLPNRSPIPAADHFLRYVHPSVIGVLRRERYDAVIVHGYAHATEWLAFLGAWASRTPLFLRGESTLLGRRRPWVRAGKRWLLGPVLRRMRGMLAIGELNREFYRAYGVPEDRIFSVPYAVDNERFMADADRLRPERAALRRQLGWAADRPVILYSGKLIAKKRPLDLVDAASRLAADGAPLFVLMGDGPLRGQVEAEVTRRGLAHVRVTGFVNQGEISRYYAAADVLALPSGYEPWGLALNEGMCFGLPVVASDAVGAAPDLVRDGENGFVYPAGDADALADALRRVLRDPERRAQMGVRSREIVSGYSYEADLRGILEALGTLHPDRAAVAPSAGRGAGVVDRS
ncbi:MAG TPA: glycosyltransferase family 4 protein [bacterium]|nr:glycosyltransferase family 4 protein [bacterium]